MLLVKHDEISEWNSWLELKNGGINFSFKGEWKNTVKKTHEEKTCQLDEVYSLEEKKEISYCLCT